jgi:hypothetical protein
MTASHVQHQPGERPLPAPPQRKRAVIGIRLLLMFLARKRMEVVQEASNPKPKRETNLLSDQF